MAPFKNREDAGRLLAESLAILRMDSPVLQAVPRGGIPVAVPIARALNLSVSVVPLRHLSVPWDETIVFGYVTHRGDLHLNQPLIGQLRITPQEIYQISKREQTLLQEDLERWGVVPAPHLAQKTALIVDDGMHTGWTLFSAVECVRKLGAGKIMAAVPVSHFRAKRFVSHHCDEVISLVTENVALFQIGDYYDDFPEISDSQIKSMLGADPTPTHQTAA